MKIVPEVSADAGAWYELGCWEVVPVSRQKYCKAPVRIRLELVQMARDNVEP